jgi:hypothetical protein
MKERISVGFESKRQIGDWRGFFIGAPQAYNVARISDPQSRLPAQASLLWLRHRGVHRTPATQRDSDYENV